MSSAEIVETQNVIIKLQSSVIDDLFKTLSQYIAPEDMDTIRCIEKINMAASMRNGMEG